MKRPRYCSGLCLLTALALLSYLRITVAQFGNPDSPTQNVCPSLLTKANMTGGTTYTTALDFNLLGQWLIGVETNYSADTVSTAISSAAKTSPDASTNIWLDLYVGVDLNDYRNPYSACAFVFKGLPHNTILRGQDDDTSCQQTLSKNCVDALTNRAALNAEWLTRSPTLGPYSNLTPPILEPICSVVLNSLGTGSTGDDAFPRECQPYFDDGSGNYPSTDLMVLTNNASVSRNCSLYPSDYASGTQTIIGGPESYPPGFRYDLNNPVPTHASTEAYDNLTYAIWPIMTVLMPQANVSRQSSIAGGKAYMTCLRAKNFTNASRVPPALPAPTAVLLPGQLSKGAEAGVAVGAIVGALAVFGALWWGWSARRKRRAAKELEKTENEDNGQGGVEIGGKTLSEVHGQYTFRGTALDGTPMSELRAKAAPQEVEGELAAEEMEGSARKPQELMASEPLAVGAEKATSFRIGSSKEVDK